MIRWAPSLLTRLIAILFLVGVIPVGLLAYRLIGLNRSAMDKQVEESHALFARSASEQAGSFVATQLLLARSLAGNPALQDPRSPGAQVVLRQSLTSWSALDVLGIAVVNRDGETYLLAQLADPEARRRVERALAADPAAEVLALAGTPTPLLRSAAPLPGELGYVWLVSDGQALLDALDTFELGEGSAEALLTTQGGEDLVGSTRGLPAELLEAARTGYVQGTNVSFTDPASGDEQIGAYAPVPHTDWMVISRQPSQLARRVALDMQRQSQIALGLVALAIVALSGVAYASVVRPIRQLARAQRRLAGLPGAGRGSEIDQLKASFEALERRLKEQRELGDVFLGRYEILEVLGAGAMGTVFLAYDPKLHRKVAIKTIRLGRQLEEKKRQDLGVRLLDEARTTAKFNHPNIVSVFDVEDTEDAAFVLMEFVEGVSLEQMVWKLGQLDAKMVMPLGAAIARALSAAHSHEMVHRDVKPANVLLGKDGSIKVTDFGIAELLTSVAPKADVVFGTPGYLPPEALQGKGYDETGDLFSLGAVLYFCLTAARPFEGKTVKDVVRKTLFSTAPPPSQLASGIPRELEALIVSLLDPDPKARPSSAKEVAERLEEMAQEHKARWDPPESLFAEPEPIASETAFLPTTKLAAKG